MIGLASLVQLVFKVKPAGFWIQGYKVKGWKFRVKGIEFLSFTLIPYTLYLIPPDPGGQTTAISLKLARNSTVQPNPLKVDANVIGQHFNTPAHGTP